MATPKKIPPAKKIHSSKEPKKNLLLRFANLILIAAVLIVYWPTFNLGYTELDDSIFIKETRDYNQDLSNLTTSFQRGVFNETEDVYYRPLLLDSFILNYHISDENIRGWHIVNVILHLIAVLLLFLLLKKVGLDVLSSFLLTLIFAVHPMLSQAVAWIPGRNDTLLAIFVFSFLIGAIEYANTKKIPWLVLQCLALLAALFTKETAVFAAPVAWMLIIFLKKRNPAKILASWFDRTSIMLYSSWLIAGVIWFVIRSQATLKNSELQFGDVLKTFPTRLPVLIQYLGKIFLPLNLNVFPITQDTTYIYGIISVFILALIIFLSPNRDWRVIVAGIAIYILLFIPALLVPASLNDQDFEHRAYLPMFGILITLSQTVLLKNNLKQSTLIIGGIALCVVLSIVNLNHQKNFKTPLTFWTAAQKSSPHSAYATMMLGARLDSVDHKRGEELIRKAYAMDSAQKYINYYMGVMLQSHDSILQSEKFFKREREISDYYMCTFHLARVAFVKDDKPAAIQYLETYLSKAPGDPQANNNLLLLYHDTHQPEKEKEQAEKMKLQGLKVPPGY
ncbi:MAG TPA: tetratricopeptide repeat protein [Chitinophagales bacterium]|nr:tetratricopeptide repeat protein [Chitinophagales bacterium]